MSKNLPVVALVGRTNAGKSSLFNRLLGEKRAIVAREAGTTRDAISAKISTEKGDFLLVDTAGLKAPEDDFEQTIQDQVADAVENADAVLYVVDSTEYPAQKDQEFAHQLLKSKKPVFLVLNKTDLKNSLPAEEFQKFAIKNIIKTSAEHNQGIERLKSSIDGVVLSSPQRDSRRTARASVTRPVTTGSRSGAEVMENDLVEPPPTNNPSQDIPVKLALIGRPNTGKSTLFNALGKKQQAITSNRAGTTRDINRLEIKFKNQTLEILDTAGIRRPGKVEQGIEKFSVLRTLSAVEESDICLLTLDATELNTALDQKLAGQITEAGKGIIIVVTKWDIAENEDGEKTPYLRDEIAAKISRTFDFLPYAPLVFTSAITGQNVTKIFDLGLEIQARRHQQIKTRELNKVLQKAIQSHPPAGLKNTHPKLRYIVQTDVAPPWFVVYGAHLKHIHWSYTRYLERQLRENFDLIGTPINFSFRDEKQIQANKNSKRNPSTKPKYHKAL